MCFKRKTSTHLPSLVRRPVPWKWQSPMFSRPRTLLYLWFTATGAIEPLRWRKRLVQKFSDCIHHPMSTCLICIRLNVFILRIVYKTLPVDMFGNCRCTETLSAKDALCLPRWFKSRPGATIGWNWWSLPPIQLLATSWCGRLTLHYATQYGCFANWYFVFGSTESTIRPTWDCSDQLQWSSHRCNQAQKKSDYHLLQRYMAGC